MHHFITSPCSFTPPLVQARATKWTFFNHHFTVVFWLTQSLKAHKFTVCGRHGRQHETPHIILCAAWKMISFTLWPNKSFPRLKQNANSTLLRFCVLQSKLLCQKKNEAGSFETSTWGQNWPSDIKQNALGSRCHQWSVMVEPEISQVNVHYQRGVKSGLDCWHSTIRLFN